MTGTGAFALATMPIPKKLHIIWVGDEGKRPDACIKTWRLNHPGWEFHLWGNAECESNSWRCRRQLESFRSEGAWNGVADVMRYEILLRHGGVYVDADSISVRPLDDWLLEHKMFAAWESEQHRPGLVASGFIGSVPGHAALVELITRIEAMDLAGDKEPWMSVGPGLFTEVVRGYAPDDVTILPSILFLPRHYEDECDRTGDAIYARHFWGTTLGSYGANLFKPVEPAPGTPGIASLTVRGPFLTRTGHGHHTRAFTRELVRQGIAVELQDVPQWSLDILPPDMREPWFYSLQAPVASKIMLHFCMPHQVAPDPRKLNVNFTMFEASRAPAEWIRRNLTHDLLIVPTESSRRAWEASGMLPHRIRLCPLGVDTEAFSPGAGEAKAGEPRVRFLNVSEYSSRKNLGGLLRAWMLATRADDPAILTIKTNRTMKAAYLPAGLDRAAPVRILRAPLADAEMPGLYRAATHYISASFGEGWDLPMMEAAATGLKLIAPDHSAYRDYLDASVATMVPARSVPVVYDTDAETAKLFENAEWWEPDEEALAAAIRAAIAGRDTVKACARERILDRYSWAAVTRHLIGILSALEPLAEKKQYALELLRNRLRAPGGAHSRPAGPPDRDPA